MSSFVTRKQFNDLYSLFTVQMHYTVSNEVISFSQEQLGLLGSAVKNSALIPFLHVFFQCYSSLYTTVCFRVSQQ